MSTYASTVRNAEQKCLIYLLCTIHYLSFSCPSSYSSALSCKQWHSFQPLFLWEVFHVYNQSYCPIPDSPPPSNSAAPIWRYGDQSWTYVSASCHLPMTNAVKSFVQSQKPTCNQGALWATTTLINIRLWRVFPGKDALGLRNSWHDGATATEPMGFPEDHYCRQLSRELAGNAVVSQHLLSYEWDPTSTMPLFPFRTALGGLRWSHPHRSTSEDPAEGLAVNSTLAPPEDPRRALAWTEQEGSGHQFPWRHQKVRWSRGSGEAVMGEEEFMEVCDSNQT